MENLPCQIPNHKTAAPPKPVSDGRCTHLRADGKRCASAVYPGHSSLCHYHLIRQMHGIVDGDVLASDILSAVGNFQSAAAINVVLALCYNCQLLLQALLAVKQEPKDGGYDGFWQKETARILASDSLSNLTFTSLLPKRRGPLQPTPAPQSDPSPASEATL